jgi:hypothetical protein
VSEKKEKRKTNKQTNKKEQREALTLGEFEPKPLTYLSYHKYS